MIPAKYQHTFITALFVAITITAWSGVCFGQPAADGTSSGSVYTRWKAVGQFAADLSLEMIQNAGKTPDKKDLIVLTNAGYAQMFGMPTQGVLDGLAAVTGASRGKNTLVEIHAAAWDPLWVAVHDPASGWCAYLEMVQPGGSDPQQFPDAMSPDIFGIRTVERIDADYLYAHAKEFETRMAGRIFGDNAFRVITIANAVASGAPARVVRAFEFHDHYCPGVMSGIFMADYVQAHFPPGRSGYVVHGIDPWCKEDALMTLLNATPGKKKYAVTYPSEADRARRLPAVETAATIIYRQNDQTGQWEGILLGFDWADTSCPKTGNVIIDKLCIDLWYLERIDSPETFVKVLKTVTLPDGVSPMDWATPGTDPLGKMGLTVQ
ncbi:FmdE family protein [Desulfotignum phosphitoxidans]|uniref:Formylmethanofuran dehydrogenase subunit FmdE n=1 Tax=Desulfotignum phosphitoxidans DSM 13687 TaxID=1286635 RepID=S0G372_9BACT|nr:FmdE family protein [Desulfotignum phosphitoxidans]EMS81340.1 formylmethanofuran dehydrogenase subunit FmdE [Desulfotignum phosphitoxidans DSM 13687]